MNATVTVVAPGVYATVQDLGRPGWLHAGVGVAGAADRRSCTLANRLVGNDESAATIECLWGGLCVEFPAPALAAVTGASVPITVAGQREAVATVLAVSAGQRVQLGHAEAGLRCYLAIRGGIAVPAVLGSRSRDTLAQLGPPPLAAGAQLPLGPTPLQWPRVAVAPVPTLTTDPLTVAVWPGPRDDWFVRPGDLFVGWWRACAQLDRIGVRLQRVGDAPALRRSDAAELPTEGMALGAIQVPPAGQPVVLLADHPITGGYPVIGCVVDADVDRVAQLRPGQLVRFVAAVPSASG